MSLSENGIKERLELKAYLIKQGFKVHGVITTKDIQWAETSQQREAYSNLQYEGEKWCGQEFEDYIKANHPAFLPILTEYDPKSCEVGKAFEDAQQKVKTPSSEDFLAVMDRPAPLNLLLT
ncbi:MAG: hypothetical protein WC785_03040 [Tatlockia sp.]|jgi:hypothetical protein